MIKIFSRLLCEKPHPWGILVILNFLIINDIKGLKNF